MNTAQYNPTTNGSAEQENNIPVVSRWFGSWRFSIERKPLDSTELANRYTALAEIWQSKLERLGVTDNYRSLIEYLIDHLQLDKTSKTLRVLDCGVGTAELSLALGKARPQSVQISGIDISPGMLKQAGCKFDTAGIDVDLKQADVRELPYPDNTFDAVIAAHILEHLSSPSTALQEIHRVLKPGGSVLVCCTRRSLSGRFIQIKWRTHAVSASQLEKWFIQAGFAGVMPVPIDASAALARFSSICIADKNSAMSMAA